MTIYGFVIDIISTQTTRNIQKNKHSIQNKTKGRKIKQWKVLFKVKLRQFYKISINVHQTRGVKKMSDNCI